jgi:two-component system sensor histidine kinase UhpB
MTAANILLVEDENLVALDVRRQLERAGYTIVGVATTGAEAVQAAVATKPDLVLMHLRLGGELDGIEAASSIHSYLDVPVISLSDAADASRRTRVKTTEPLGYILEPFAAHELEATIEGALHKHRVDGRTTATARWFASMLNCLGDAVIATDPHGRVTFLNLAAEELTGWPQAAAVGQELSALFRLAHAATGEPVQDPACRVLRAGTLSEMHQPRVLHTQHNRAILVVENTTPIRDDEGRLLGAVVVLRDRTAPLQADDVRQQAQDIVAAHVASPLTALPQGTPQQAAEVASRKLTTHASRHAHQQLREAATCLHNLQEAERAHIARDIHDELGQIVTGLHLDTAWLRHHLTDAPPQVRERLQAMANLTKSLGHSVRRIATALRPQILDDLGLISAIEWLLEDARKRTGLSYTLTPPTEDLVLDNTRCTSVFRIVQEALTNVLRHAEAHHVAVRIIQEPATFVVEIADDGKGITAAQLSQPSSLGIVGMRERARLWHGDVTLHGSPGHGTIVTVQLPLR